jgi:hypothetical protein
MQAEGDCEVTCPCCFEGDSDGVVAEAGAAD